MDSLPRVVNYETCYFKGFKLHYSFEVIQIEEKKQLTKQLIGRITFNDVNCSRLREWSSWMHNERKYQHQKIPYQIPKLGLQLAVNTWKREQKRAAIRNEILPESEDMLIDEITLESGTTYTTKWLNGTWNWWNGAILTLLHTGNCWSYSNWNCLFNCKGEAIQ